MDEADPSSESCNQPAERIIPKFITGYNRSGALFKCPLQQSGDSASHWENAERAPCCCGKKGGEKSKGKISRGK